MNAVDIAITKQNDVLDDICFRHYGKTQGVVEQVLEVNPGLAELPERLPAGQKIYLPVIAPVAKQTTINLWD